MKEGAIDLAWQLYADAATRANLLIDECAHIQNTIRAHLSDLGGESFGCSDDAPIDASCPERAWIPEPSELRKNGYYQDTPQRRALRNLYASIGGLALAIGENAKTLGAAFDRVIDAERILGSDRTDALFWFISLRGHQYGNVFRFYLAHIEHAQRKLIQLLENMPGTLPGPTLMRRWSSAGYGEFLSSYSRNVNAQIQSLYFEYCSPASSGSFDEWRSDQVLVHTWAHNPTSHTTKTRVGMGPANRGLSMTTVWSSYFYLEQPILFPLLYHECAHHFENKTIANLAETDDREVNRRRKLWFGRAEEAAGLLHRLCPLPDRDLSFWQQFTGELWADLISISRCGSGFFAALVLQVTGLQGGYGTFSEYGIADDVRIPLEESGRLDRRVLEVQYPSLDLAYFWEARLRFAIAVYRKLFRRDGLHKDTWVENCEALLDAWYASGSHAMSERVASSEHASFWKYRETLNSWVFEVVWDCMHDFTSSLVEPTLGHANRNEFRLDDPLMSLIERDVDGYARHVFEGSAPLVAPFDRSISHRLEDICPHFRCEFAKQIVPRLLNSSSISSAESQKKWYQTYIDHMACDGSVGFRLAQEWIEVVKDLYVSASTVLTHVNLNKPVFRPPPLLTASEHALLQGLFKAGVKDLRSQRDGGVDEATRDRNTAELAKIQYFRLPDHWSNLAAEVAAFKSRLLTALEGLLTSESDGVGTLTLGVLKPMEFYRHRGYQQAFKRTSQYFESLNNKRLDAISRGGLHARPSPAQFYPLFGEYNFAAFQPGLASINKSFHTISHPACLTKPRAVLRLASADANAAHASFVRVCQIAFQFRWQWVLLMEALDGSAELYLSSAWEDLILVTHHQDFRQFKSSCHELGLRQRPWLDIHSSFGLPDVLEKSRQAAGKPEPQPEREPGPGGASAEGNELDSATAATEKHQTRAQKIAGQVFQYKPLQWATLVAGRVFERTGRFDLAIDWSAQTPAELWNSLQSIPPHEWRSIESIVSALEIDHLGDSTQLTSQIILKHDAGT